ncbi:MAG: heavy-metal-associated domain-containing protein [Bacteroidetes bacterium]|nr:heavy-metal-associated domain-containing protein [Bacteroidota bacterium]HNR20183.1 heavy metal-associated domain-containing protein [Bacteroidia bacterium]HNU34699.1 heavy metal-associated domain-containing protein [Bacteroidia bacterium]
MIRNYLITTLLLLQSFVLFAGGNETIVIRTKIYCDHCKECESCKPRIDNSVKYLKGVKFSKLNVEEQTITVQYNPKKTTAAQIREAISKSGFDADEIKAEGAAYKKLDDCCKKK